MARRGSTLGWALALGLAGCAGADDPATSSGTDGSSGSEVTGDDTNTFPSTDPSTDPTSDPTTASDPSESDTADDTTTTGDSGTGSTGEGTGTTGICDVGTENCACAPEDPRCEKGLECVEDVCVMPLCGAKDDEPNDLPDEAVDLGDYQDNDDPDSVVSQLAGTDDVDWFTYHCVDTLAGDLDPALIIDQADELRVCFFLDCDNGGNPLFSCPEGTVSEEAPFDFLPGCCVTDGSSFDLSDYNCPDSSDDSVSAWIRVDEPGQNACVAYSITYQC